MVAGANQHSGAGFANRDAVIDKKDPIGRIRLALSRRADGFVARRLKERVHTLVFEP
jgi:hypothetical protein